MKRTIKILLTILFLIELIYMVYKLIINYSNDGLIFAVVAFTSFISFLFAWIAPKSFFNLCWKITNLMEYSFDYDYGLKKLESVSIGLLVFANTLLTIGILIA